MTGMADTRRRVASLITLAVLAFSLLCIAGSPAWSRMWKPSKAILALDYAQIIDNRGNGNMVVVWWLVPQMFNDEKDREIFGKYVVLGLLQGRMSATGAISFVKFDDIRVSATDRTPLAVLGEDRIPPAVNGTLGAMEMTLRRTIGPMGEGLHWLVFDGAGVGSCTKGRLSVSFAGENYTFETPIPGCP